MHDSVEVEVEVIEFDVVGVGSCDVDRNGYAVYFFRRFFDDSRDYFGILFTEPAEGRRDTSINSMYFYGARTPYLRVIARTVVVVCENWMSAILSTGKEEERSREWCIRIVNK